MSYPRRGEIHLADPKARPALIVSMDVRNRLANDVMVVPLSTTLRASPTHVELPTGEGGVVTISPALMREIEKAIQRAIGIPVA